MQQAATVGHVRAQYSLASMYLAGRGTPVDFKAAEMWAQRAADKGHDKAAVLLGEIAAKRSAPKESPAWKAAASDDPQAISGRAAAVSSDTGKALIDAARRGNLEATKALIKRGAPLESRDDDGNTALGLAAGAGHARIVEALLSAGAKANARNSSQETPLIRAASQNRGPEVELLAKISDVDAKRADNATALTLALRRCSEKTVNALLAAHANLNDGSGEPSPLSLASLGCGAGIVKAIMERGAHVNEADSLGRTPLWHAADRGNVDAALVLMHGAGNPGQPDKNGVTAFLHALERGHAELASRMLAEGADPNQATASGNTPLMLAAKLGSAPLVEALIRAGAKVDARNAFGNSALMIAASEGQTAAARTLLAAGADRSLRNKKREKAVDVASAAGHSDLAEALK
jgi:ankyrin repeat protein